jgi:hypothetical protein
VSETVWNWGLVRGAYFGTGGGISDNYSIPTWQQGISMAASGGSTIMRNVPDVAMTADGIYVAANGTGYTGVGGTSAAAPLWAGFTALVNQQAAANGQPPVGFINKAIYAIGKSSAYSSCFHDITTGNNTSSSSPTSYYAVAGYDLCTGWGTPAGQSLINALAAAPVSGPPKITVQPADQTATVGGSVTFSVSAGGTTPLSYFWRRNGTPIAGATGSSYTTNNVQLLDGGSQFSCLVSNTYGTALSSNALLNVGDTSGLGAAVNYPTVPWATFGDAPWREETSVTHDGVSAAQSGTVGKNQSSTLEVALVGPGTLSFWFYPVFGSSGDWLKVSVGTSSVHSYLYFGTGWYQEYLPVPEGPQLVQWEFGSTDTAAHSVYLDQVSFASIPTALLTVLASPTNGGKVSGGGNYAVGSQRQIAATANTAWAFIQWQDGNTQNPRTVTIPSEGATYTASFTDLSVAAPFIISQPTNQMVGVGTNVSFTVGAVGAPPLSYYWRQNGTPIPGAYAATYTIPSAQLTNSSSQFSCLVSNPLGTALSSNALLIVNPPAEVTISLAGMWAGAGSHDSRALWKQGSLVYLADGAYGVQIIDVSNPAIPVRRGYYLNGNPAWSAVAAAGNYVYAKAPTGGGGPEFDMVLNVSNPALPTVVSSRIHNEDGRGLYVTGNYLYAAVGASGMYVEDISTPSSPVYKGGFNTSGLAYGVKAVGNYAYVADGSSGLAIIDVSNPSSLALKGDIGTSGEALGVFVSGNYAYVADGSAGLQIIDVSDPANPVWKAAIPTGGYAQDVAVSGGYAYVTAGTNGVQIINVKNPLSPTYETGYVTTGEARMLCVSNNYTYLADGASALVILKVQTPTPQPPQIVQSPLNQTVIAAASATFSVSATGLGLSYQWRKNGVNLSDGGNVAGATTSCLTLSGVQASDAANYDVVVTNSDGAVTSAAATLTVLVPPAISSGPLPQTVAVGASATFSVSASGTAPLGYVWRRNGSSIAGATNSSYTTNNVQLSDSGSQFSCAVSNSAGLTLSQVALLSVTNPITPPAITQQPADQVVAAGASATFNVSATGTAPLSYFWLRESMPIAGANGPSYTTNNVQAADSGSRFSCVVSNPAGTATSGPATLTVIPASPIIHLVAGGLAADGRVTFNVLSDAGSVLEIQSSTNLAAWAPIATITNAVGTIQFKDPLPPGGLRRFYRARQRAHLDTAPIMGR